MPLPLYFPFMHGVYDVKAGITALTKDFGNGPLDQRVFQSDEQRPIYRRAKEDALQRPDRHALRDRFDAETEQEIARWSLARLIADEPANEWDAGFVGQSLDDFAIHIQEDLAVLVIDQDGKNRLAYMHVCMPSGWAPEEKIGRPFDQVHAPVPHIKPISDKQESIARLMVNAIRGALRFAWTITDDAALNHHPKRDRSAEHPSPLPDHPAGEPLLRVERQVIQGFPDQQASLFLIRTYLYPFDALDHPTRSALAKAVSGMSDQSLAYKHMDRALILDRLRF